MFIKFLTKLKDRIEHWVHYMFTTPIGIDRAMKLSIASSRGDRAATVVYVWYSIIAAMKIDWFRAIYDRYEMRDWSLHPNNGNMWVTDDKAVIKLHNLVQVLVGLFWIPTILCIHLVMWAIVLVPHIFIMMPVSILLKNNKFINTWYRSDIKMRYNAFGLFGIIPTSLHDYYDTCLLTKRTGVYGEPISTIFSEGLTHSYLPETRSRPRIVYYLFDVPLSFLKREIHSMDDSIYKFHRICGYMLLSSSPALVSLLKRNSMLSNAPLIMILGLAYVHNLASALCSILDKKLTNSSKDMIGRELVTGWTKRTSTYCNLLVWLPTSTLWSRTSLLSVPQIAYFWAFMLSLITLWVGYENTNLATLTVVSMAVWAPVFLVWQTFIFFFKLYRVSKYTTQVQRFWKRTLMLFWAIEGFLYIIVVFIWFISPKALTFGMDHAHISSNKYITLQYFCIKSLPVCALLVLISLAMFQKKTNNTLSTPIILLMVVTILWGLLVSEFMQLMYLFSKFSATVELCSTNRGCGDIFTEIANLPNKSVCSNSVYILLIFLRFWHILFIAVYLLFSILKYLEDDYISYDVLSSNMYNMSALYAFNLTPLVYTFKKQILFYIKQIPHFYYADSYKDSAVSICLETFSTACAVFN